MTEAIGAALRKRLNGAAGGIEIYEDVADWPERYGESLHGGKSGGGLGQPVKADGSIYEEVLFQGGTCQMDMTVGLGLLAGGLTTASFVPQVLKIWKTKSAEDVSLTMFVAFCVGVGLWLAYGVIKKDWAILATNGVTLILGLAILVMKIKYK